ncbi:MAG: hypothetical protein WED04_07235 [Promethearchaeati archaeon SRVP18_Atabeyarchaeia-1]
MVNAKIARIVVTLTPSESKRIIGKAVAKMDVVSGALKDGSVLIGVGTTNSFVAEEVTGRRIDKQHFSAGIITPQGLGMTNVSKRLYPLLIRRGEITEIKPADLPKLFEGMGPKDVFIKGANAIDHEGNAGVITVDPAGGTIGAAWKALKNNGMKLVVPVGLEKTIPWSLNYVKRRLEEGNVKIWKQMGLPLFKIYLLPGEVVTEIASFKILSNVEAVPLAGGGIAGAEGSVTLMLEGDEENVRKAWEIANQVKGEPAVTSDPLKLL